MKDLTTVIEKLQREVEWRTNDIAKLQGEIKTKVNHYNALEMITFLPGDLKSLEKLMNDLKNTSEQLQMLKYISK